MHMDQVAGKRESLTSDQQWMAVRTQQALVAELWRNGAISYGNIPITLNPDVKSHYPKNRFMEAGGMMLERIHQFVSLLTIFPHFQVAFEDRFIYASFSDGPLKLVLPEFLYTARDHKLYATR